MRRPDAPLRPAVTSPTLAETLLAAVPPVDRMNTHCELLEPLVVSKKHFMLIDKQRVYELNYCGATVVLSCRCQYFVLRCDGSVGCKQFLLAIAVW